jgi:hypothetical protein
MGGKKEKGESRVKLLACRRHCTYTTEIVWKQHAKLSRLKKPDIGKWTSGAYKETGQRRQKENGIAIKRTNGQRKMEQRMGPLPNHRACPFQSVAVDVVGLIEYQGRRAGTVCTTTSAAHIEVAEPIPPRTAS